MFNTRFFTFTSTTSTTVVRTTKTKSFESFFNIRIGINFMFYVHYLDFLQTSPTTGINDLG